MQSIQLLLRYVFILVHIIAATTSSSLSCDRVALGSESSTKWTVSCVSSATISTSTASFNPLLVQNFYVDNGNQIAASSSSLKLSSAFSLVNELVSSSVTSFSLLAASNFTPKVPVTIVSTAFSELSALKTLHLEGFPLADSDLHLVLPKSIEKISIVNCGLENISFEFPDGSALAESALNFIDLRLNDFTGIPAVLYDMPSGVSTIDLQNNAMNLSSEISEHKKQLNAWSDAEVLKVDNSSLLTLKSTQDEINSASNTVKEEENETKSQIDSSRSTISSDSQENVTVMEEDGNMDVIPITILAIVIPAIIAVGISLVFITRKRRQMQERESIGILDLPLHFDKDSRDRCETSGFFTIAESELSRSRMSSGMDPKNDNNSCGQLTVTPSAPDHQQHSSTRNNAGYINLESPQKAPSFSLTNSEKQHDEDRNSTQSLELLGTHSTASMTAVQARIGARKALSTALETLLKTKTMLIVNGNQYSFNPGTCIEETPIAFFVDCRYVGRSSEDASLQPAPPARLVLKVFIEDDADLAGRESYALSCLQKDHSTSAFVPLVVDEALEYELEIAKLSCCILVLEKLNCTTLPAHVADSRDLLTLQVSRIVKALHGLHTCGLVHGALNSDSLLVCSPDAQLKFWGLEYATRAGHKFPSSEDEVGLSQADCVAPELASLALEQKLTSQASISLDIWSLGVLILKLHASGHQLEEFNGCTASHEVFERLKASEWTETCFFERSIARFVQNDDMKNLLRSCLQYNSTSRPSTDFILKHKVFQTVEREVTRATTVKVTPVSRLLSAIMEEKDVFLTSGEPEREASGKDQLPDKIHVELVTKCDDSVRELLPPSLWLFVPPVELKVDLTHTYSVEEWVFKLQQLQQQKAEDLRFPLIFMCESSEPNAAVPCSLTTSSKYGASVPSSLLSLVMPLVRETMLFLEARAILSNGLSVSEASGLPISYQWEELRTFYRALERMELATVNPVNEVELAPMEQQLKSRDPSIAQNVLNVLTAIIFSKEKREYVRNLLDVLVSGEALETQAQETSWAGLRRYEVGRWLCSNHAP